MVIQRSFSALVPALLIASLASACGDDEATDGDSSTGGTGAGAAAGGAGGMSTGGAGGLGGTGGQGGAIDPFEQAVKDAAWTTIPGAPSAGGGAKQDDIYFVDGSVGFIAGGPSNTVYRTDDAGVSWTPIFNSAGTFFRAVHFIDAQHGFAGNLGAGLSPSISDPNVIYETLDGGQNWAPVTNITGPAPEGICNFNAVDENNIFAIGRANGPSHLMVSNDGGATWTAKDLGGQLLMAIDARFTSPTTGIVAGMGQTGRCTVLRTTDGGDSFDEVFTATASGSLCWKLDFPSNDIGYVAIQQTSFGPGAFGKTTDGGLTWEEMPLPTDSAYAAIGMGFINDTIGWVVPNAASAPAYRTFDGGQTWEEEPNLVAPVNRFRFTDATTGYAIGAQVWKLEVDVP